MPGRLRLRLAALAAEEYRDEITGRLNSDTRIKDVFIRTSCLSLTITYEPDALSIEEILALLDADRRPPVPAQQDLPPACEPEAAATRIPEERQEAEVETPEDEGEVVSVEATASPGREEAAVLAAEPQPSDEPSMEQDIAYGGMVVSEGDTEGMETTADQPAPAETTGSDSYLVHAEVVEAAAGETNTRARPPEPEPEPEPEIERKRTPARSRYTTGKKIAGKIEPVPEPKKRRRKEKAGAAIPEKS